MAKQTIKGQSSVMEPAANQTIVVPPDGGWGWIIVGIGFLGGFLVDGVSLAFSIIQTDLTRSFHESSISISLVLSIFNCITFLLGPVTSAMANRFGFRVLMFFGTLLYCAGFGLSFVVQNYALLIVCFSIMSGIGASFIYMVLMACPGYWFEEKRSIAFGLVSASSGFTCILMPILSEYVSRKLGWRYVFLQLAVLGCLALLSSFLIKKPPVAVIELATSDITIEPIIGLNRNAPMTLSLATIGGPSRIDKKLRTISQHTGIQFQPKYIPRPSSSDIGKPAGFKKFWLKITGQYNKDYVERPMYKKDIFFQSKTSIIMKKYNMQPGEYTLSVQKMTTLKDLEQQTRGLCTCCPEAIIRPMKEMLDFSLLKNIIFIILALDTFFYYFSCYLPYVYITKSLTEKGVSEGTSIMSISLYGIGVSVSRLIIGLAFIIFPKISTTYLASGLTIASSIFILGVSFTVNDVAVIIMVAGAGLFIGPWVPLRSVLMVEYLGLEKLTSAMGLLFGIQALGCLIGMPITEFVIAYFNEIYWNYYIIAAFWLLAGLLIGPLEFISKRKQHELEDTALYRK